MVHYRMINSKPYKLVGKCNSEACGAWCCTHVLAQVDLVNPDDEKYFKAHGCEIQHTTVGNKAHVLVPVVCRHLMAGKCTIYEDRFDSCRNYARRPSDIFFSPRCTLVWKEVIGREAQKAMKELRGL